MHYMLCSIGTNFTWEAENSAKSIKINTPKSHITLYTDTPPKRPQYFDQIIPIPPPPTETNVEKYAKTKRIECLLNHQQEAYIHLDVDTYVAHDPSHIFNNTFDVACILNIWRISTHNLVEGTLAVNKSQTTDTLFKNWLTDYTNDPGLTDQMHFDHHARKTKVHILPPEMCAIVSELTQYSGKIYITHRHYENEYLNAIIPAVLLNQTTDNRVWIPAENRAISSTWSPETGIIYTNHYVTQQHRKIAQEFIRD